MASVDYFLKLDGIDGESTDDKHKDEIHIESFSWGVSNASSAAAGGGGGAGKVAFQDFHFVKKVDKASPQLMLHCATGQHIKKAVLYVRKSGGDDLRRLEDQRGDDDWKDDSSFMTVQMQDLLVSSFQQGAGGSGDPEPTDQFSLNFTKIEFEYKPQKPDGSLDAPVKAGYDLKANKKL